MRPAPPEDDRLTVSPSPMRRASPGATITAAHTGPVPGAQEPHAATSGSPSELDDPRWVEDCYQRLGPMVLAYLRRWVPAQDAEDVLQQVFLEVWRSRHRYDPGRPMEAWVLGIAHKRGIDQVRRRSRLPDGLDGVGAAYLPDPLDLPDPTDFAAAYVMGSEVREALSHLPPEQREALVLAYFADLTQAQIADRLGVPVGTVKARSYRGLRKLAAVLVPQETP